MTLLSHSVVGHLQLLDEALFYLCDSPDSVLPEWNLRVEASKNSFDGYTCALLMVLLFAAAAVVATAEEGEIFALCISAHFLDLLT